MAGNSLTEIAYSILKKNKKSVLFNELWKEVSEEKNFTEDMSKRKIASFYNALMLDARFISLDQNFWDLPERYVEDTLKIDPDLTMDADYDEDYEYDDLLNE